MLVEFTRLDGSKFFLNVFQIEIVEANPDTVIRMMNGNKYVVRESVIEVRNKVEEVFRDTFGFKTREGV